MQVDVIQIRLTPAEAELAFVAVPAEGGPTGDLELHGRLVGPRNAYAETIEVAYPLKPLPREGELLRARAIMPDPCFWSPAQPLWYEGQFELRRGGGKIAERRLPICLRELRLHPRKGLRLNGAGLRLDGRQRRRLDEAEAAALHGEGVNLLVAPLAEPALPLWELGVRHGFFVLGEVDPEDEPLLWEASEKLSRSPAAFGWLLPQTLIRQPQRWHNAVSLLHGQRTDLLVGVKVEETPLGALPGHVAFAAGRPELLEEIQGAGLPGLALLRRGQAEGGDSAVLGAAAR